MKTYHAKITGPLAFWFTALDAMPEAVIKQHIKALDFDSFDILGVSDAHYPGGTILKTP